VFALVVLLGGVVFASPGGGQQPGSDEWVDREAGAIAKQAASDLKEALTRLSPCSPTKQQIGDVYDALGRLQATGDDTPAADAAVASRVAPAARSIARAVARGEAVGYDGRQADALADGAGIDTQERGWMDDPACEKHWTALVEMVSVSEIPGVRASRVLTARVGIEIDANGAVTGSADAKVVTSMSPVPPCTFRFADGTTGITIGGSQAGGVFSLTLSHAPFTSNGQAQCALPAGTMTTPTPIPWEAMLGLPITVPAKGGAQGRDASGTVTITMLTRR